MNVSWLILPVLLPIVGGALLPLFRFQNKPARHRYCMSVVVLNTAITWGLLILRPQGTLTLFKLTQNMPIALKMDGLSLVFAAIVATLWPFATLYAFEYMEHMGGHNQFFAFYTMSFGVTLGIAFGANLITLYLFYECLTFVTLPLIMHEMNRRSVDAGLKYLMYSILGAAMAYEGMILLYSRTSSFTFVYGGLVQSTSHDPLLLIGWLLCFFGFGVKAAVFPFHGWLPTAGVAPTPVTALLHAVAVVKAGVFAIMRVTFYSYGPTFLKGTWAQDIAMAFAIFTIVFGSVMALKEQHIKRRLAYSTISNLSYIVFGVTLMTPAGLAGALCHMVFHSIMKICLFFCAGSIMHKTGREYVSQLDGFGKKMPITMASFTIGAAALTGIPMLTGFASKWYLGAAAVQTGGILPFLGVGALMISATLTAAYTFGIVIKAYFPQKEFDFHKIDDVKEAGICMKLPLICLCIAMVVFGVYSGPLVSVLTKIASSFL